MAVVGENDQLFVRFFGKLRQERAQVRLDLVVLLPGLLSDRPELTVEGPDLTEGGLES